MSGGSRSDGEEGARVGRVVVVGVVARNWSRAYDGGRG